MRGRERRSAHGAGAGVRLRAGVGVRLRALLTVATSGLLVSACTGRLGGASSGSGQPAGAVGVQSVRTAALFVQVDDSTPPDPAIEAMIAPYRSQMEAHLAEVLAQATGLFLKADPEGALDNLVADAVLHGARRLSRDRVHVALVNDGGLRVPIAEGPVTMRHTYELLPFENYIAVLTLTGAQLERLADEVARSNGEPVAGWSMVLDGDDATGVLVGGAPIDPQATYRLATVDYLADGGGTWSVLWEPAVHERREDLAVLIRDVFVEYIRERGVIHPQLDGRIRREGSRRREGPGTWQ